MWSEPRSLSVPLVEMLQLEPPLTSPARPTKAHLSPRPCTAVAVRACNPYRDPHGPLPMVMLLVSICVHP